MAQMKKEYLKPIVMRLQFEADVKVSLLDSCKSDASITGPGPQTACLHGLSPCADITS